MSVFGGVLSDWFANSLEKGSRFFLYCLITFNIDSQWKENKELIKEIGTPPHHQMWQASLVITTWTPMGPQLTASLKELYCAMAGSIESRCSSLCMIESRCCLACLSDWLTSHNSNRTVEFTSKIRYREGWGFCNLAADFNCYYCGFKTDGYCKWDPNQCGL